MTLIKRVDRQGRGLYMVWVEIKPEHAEILWLDHEPTEADAEAFVSAWLVQHEYDDTPHQMLSIYDDTDAIEDAVMFIKTNSNLTLTKWTDYLAGLPLTEKYAVQWFIMAMAEKLAEMGEFDISDFSELQILARMKNWLTNTPVRRIRKIFYGTAD